MNGKEWIKRILIFALAYCTTISIAQITNYGITGIDILLPCIFALSCIVYGKALKLGRKNEIRYALPLAAIFSATMVVGSHIDSYDNTFSALGVADFIYWLFITLFLMAVILLLYYFLDSNRLQLTMTTMQDKTKERKAFVIILGILLLCWMPYYLTFFPGNIGNDTIESINMCLGNIPWTNHHPVVFTFLINLVLKVTAFLNDLNISVGIFTFLHATAFAATLSYILIWLNRKKVSRNVLILFLLFYAFHPIIAMYSIYLTKDVLFSCVTVLFVLKIYDLVKSKGELLNNKKKLILTIFLALGVIVLRNNGILMAVGTFLCMFLVYRNKWRPLLIALCSVVLISAVYKGPIFISIGIEKQSFAESASIPLQQVGYVIWTDGDMGEEERAFLEELMPIEKVKEVYDPGYTDSYKFDEDFNDEFLNQNKGEFIKVWWKLLPDNFGAYVEAYLMQTLGYWHYGETNSVSTQGVIDNNLGIAQYDVINHIFGVSLESIMEKLVLIARKAPLLCILSSMAMQLFAVLLCISQYLRTKRQQNILALLPCILLWVSIMLATPAFCLLRYMFPVFLLWPVLVIEMLEPLKHDTNNI